YPLPDRRVQGNRLLCAARACLARQRRRGRGHLIFFREDRWIFEFSCLRQGRIASETDLPSNNRKAIRFTCVHQKDQSQAPAGLPRLNALLLPVFSAVLRPVAARPSVCETRTN